MEYGVPATRKAYSVMINWSRIGNILYNYGYCLSMGFPLAVGTIVALLCVDIVGGSTLLYLLFILGYFLFFFGYLILIDKSIQFRRHLKSINIFGWICIVLSFVWFYFVRVYLH